MLLIQVHSVFILIKVVIASKLWDLYIPGGFQNFFSGLNRNKTIIWLCIFTSLLESFLAVQTLRAHLMKVIFFFVPSGTHLELNWVDLNSNFSLMEERKCRKNENGFQARRSLWGCIFVVFLVSIYTNFVDHGIRWGRLLFKKKIMIKNHPIIFILFFLSTSFYFHNYKKYIYLMELGKRNWWYE